MKIHCKKLLFAFLLSFIFGILQAQVYQDHFGTGNTIGVTATSSDNQNANAAENTLNGTGLFPDMAGASRFLAQAGFGGSYEEIQYITQVGIEAWIDEQIALPYTNYLDTYKPLYQDIINMIVAVHPGTESEISRARTFTDFIFWDKAFKGNDVLRTKAAFALNQILVLSTRSIALGNVGYGGSDYHDILYEGAFGNFRDILFEVTMHPVMGSYLSHFQNQKADPIAGTLPDENYAREIMQLFTIGLWELNNDGTQKTDDNGMPIPTYDIFDIQELAKVFTGLSGAAYDLELFPSLAGQSVGFNNLFRRYDKTLPMIMWEEHHDQGQKIMIDDSVIPAGQPGMQDINDVIDLLFNHPNVGPFIAYRLIQQMVKSNPSPAYVNRVATVFNNNGQGVRGDMEAVFKAVLLDPEARDCISIDSDFKTGKLRQPMERFITLCRGFDIDSPSGDLWYEDFSGQFDEVEQVFMGAPTVFNFFTPFYAEDTYVEPNDMVSPEFQILHSVTSIHYLNWMEDAIRTRPFRNFTAVNPNSPRLANNDADSPSLDFSDEIAILDANGVNGVDTVIDRLDIILCHGQLSDGTKTIVQNAMTQLINHNNSTNEDAVEMGIYLIVASADYTILK